MNTYSIILKDGKIIKVDGTEIEWNDKTHHMRIFSGEKKRVVARYNMDNIAGWTESKYMKEHSC